MLNDTRLAFIDDHSGYLWGLMPNTDSVAATCASLDATIDGRRTRYTEARPDGNSGGYHVYEVSAQLLDDDVDGQDSAAIAQVETHGRWLGFFMRLDNDGERP